MNFSTRKQTMTEQITPHIEKKKHFKKIRFDIRASIQTVMYH